MNAILKGIRPLDYLLTVVMGLQELAAHKLPAQHPVRSDRLGENRSSGDHTVPARPLRAPTGGVSGAGSAVHSYPRITWAERAGALLLIAATVYIGLKPDVLLQWITPALESPVMQAVLKGGAP